MVTPIGMHFDEAVNVIERGRDWRNVYVQHEMGFVYKYHPLIIIGEKFISARLEHHPASVYWGFDEDGILIEVYIDGSAPVAGFASDLTVPIP